MNTLLGVLVLVAVSAVAYHVLRVAPAPATRQVLPMPTAQAVKLPRHAPGAIFMAFAQSARDAEAIDDPLQRCLHYPDPPGTHWNAQTTAAYCAFRLRKSIDVSQVRGFLRHHEAHELDAFFAKLLASELGAGGAGQIKAAFESAGFNKSDDAMRQQLDDWKRRSPASAFALAASGALYLAQGLEARGTAVARDLTEEQVAGMHRALALASADLDRAVALEPRLAEAYRDMLTIGHFTSDHDYVRKARDAAFAVDPVNFDLRMTMLHFATPRWSRTPGESVRQAQEAMALSQNYPLLRVLGSRPDVENVLWRELTPMQAPTMAAIDTGATSSDLGDLAAMAYGQDDYELTTMLYSEQLRFNPELGDELRWRAQAMLLIGQTAWAKESADHAVARYPDNQAILLAAALIYRKSMDLPKAIATYEGILAHDPNQEDALGYLGDLYSHEGNRPDLATMLSNKLIALNPDNPNGYIVRECVQADHGLPGRYETINYFLKRWGNDPKQAEPAEHMRGWLRAHPRDAAKA